MSHNIILDSLASIAPIKVSLLLIPAIFFIVYISFRRPKDAPGPPGLPLVGNVLDFRGVLLHKKLTEWANQYGDFYTYRQGLSDVVVLSSPETIQELFVKRGAKYSSRPQTSKQASLITQNARIVNMPYGDMFREHRRVVHSLLGTQNSKIFMPFQEYESRRTLGTLLEQPEAFFKEVVRYSASITFSMIMGCRFDRADDPIPHAIGKKMQNFFTHIRPGAWLVDWIPVLDRLPDALAPWRAKAISVREQIMPFYAVFVDEMRKRVDEGSAPDCFVAQLLEDKARAHWKDYEYQHVVAELMTAGTETTATTLQWFFKAAILNPEPIKLARKEIDDVVGRDRMPEWSDRPHLLYMDALVNELHRWASAAPLSFFHATSEDDVYRGKKITKGTVVAPNAYAVHKNPLYYPKPDTFMPERFLDPTHPLAAPEANPYRRHFGFSVGRRECPGQHVADASLYIMISRIIWAFDIRQKPDVPPGPGYSGRLPVFGPEEFSCLISPRDEETAQFIRRRAQEDRPKEMEDSFLYDRIHAEKGYV